MTLPQWSGGETEELLSSMEENTLWPSSDETDLFLNIYDEARIETMKERAGEAIHPSALPSEFEASFFGQAPREMITDPQQVLTEAEKSELLERLERHAEESDVPIHLLLFKPGQVLPATVDPASQFESWFPEGGALTLFYYHGEPARTSMELSLGSQILIPEWKRGSILKSAIEEAETVENRTLQLGRFLDKLIWKLYWLELEAGIYQVNQEAAERQLEQKVPGTPAVNGEEIAAAGQLIPMEPSPMKKQLALAGEVVARKPTGEVPGWLWMGGVPCVLVAGLGGALIARTRGRKRPRSLIFIDQEVFPRLGAPYSGGSGATMSFRARS